MSGSSQTELKHFLSSLSPEELSDPVIEAAHRRGNHGAFCAAEKVDDHNGQSELVNRARSSYVLAGLHACGDLSATMLKTYIMCEEVKAVVAVGCCYNLLSEDCDSVAPSACSLGFPLSEGVKSLGITLGQRACDLACQSAERWKDIGFESVIYNFEQHALRAGFQLVLHRYCPAIAKSNPTIGRLGKSRRRKQAKRHLSLEASKPLSNSASRQPLKDVIAQAESLAISNQDQSMKMKFTDFCSAAFQRLGLECVAKEDLEALWGEIEPKIVLVGPYSSLRAVLGPVLETTDGRNMATELLEPKLIALFDPALSPRNMAIMAIKS